MTRKIIVAGGNGALGRVVVAELAMRGYGIAIVDMAPADQSTDHMTITGIDLANEADVESTYATVADRLGRVDGLVNVAGGFIWDKVEDGAIDNWDQMYRMNLRTAVVSCRAVLKFLQPKGGAIVNVGAAAAQHDVAMGMAPYAASKAGVRALTESLANEVRGLGIRVNAVLPTIIDTPRNRVDMPDADRSLWVSPEAAAKVTAFLLSDEAGAVTGAAIPLSMGS